VARRIDQMRTTRSYLAAYPSWFDENPSLTCPRCGTDQETFKHPTLNCSARSQARDLLLKEVDSIDADSTICTDPPLLKALGLYIMSTKTGFPSEMTKEFSPPSSPYFSPSPPESVTALV